MSDQYASPAPEPRPEPESTPPHREVGAEPSQGYGPPGQGYGPPGQSDEQGYGSEGSGGQGGYGQGWDQTGPSPMSPPDQRTWGALAHLSGIVSSLLGGLSPLLPIVAYFVLRDRGSFIRHHTAEAANFQVSIFLYVVAFGLLAAITLGIGLIVAIPAWIALGIWWLVGSIMGAIKAKDGIQWRAPLTWHVFN